MAKILEEKSRSRAMEVATICATIINTAGKQAKTTVKAEDLLRSA